MAVIDIYKWQTYFSPRNILKMGFNTHGVLEFELQN